ncbi:hypothetical protein V5O48_008770, partial [Marasmius crinis-equi]
MKTLKTLFTKRSTAPLILDPLDETRPGRPLPNLPPELWVIIIRESAGSLDYGHERPHTQEYLADSSSTGIPLLSRSEYLASISQKLSCSLVSKRWNAYTAEVLYEYIWLSRARQAKALALTLLCQVCASPIVHPSTYLTHSHSSSPRTPSPAKSNQSGRHIRVLHLETPTLDKCDPLDIRVILDYAPNLLVFCDFKSIRRNLVEEIRDPRGSVEGLLKALGAARTNGEPSLLRHLVWTCYESDLIRMSSLVVSSIVEHLEFLELDFSAIEGAGGWAGAGMFGMTMGMTTMTTTTENSFLGSVSTTTTISRSSGECPEPRSANDSKAGMVIAGVSYPVLKGLKITLPEQTFALLSSWDMPQLRSLTVALTPSSPDSSPSFTLPSHTLAPTQSPFHTFFQIHGHKLLTLELSSSITPTLG